MRLALPLGFLLAIGLIGSADAAPFGLHRGDKAPALDILRDNHDGTIVLSAVPSAYPGLVQYFARFDTENGLCSVAGATAPFPGDSTGRAARDYFGRLSARLSALYGQPRRYDFALRSGPATPPDRWANELATGERIFHAFWIGNDDTGLKDAVQSIALSISTSDAGMPFVMLQFDFDNLSACETTQDRRAALAL